MNTSDPQITCSAFTEPRAGMRRSPNLLCATCKRPRSEHSSDPDGRRKGNSPLTIHNLAARLAGRTVARPLGEWHEDMGDVVWWKFPVDEPAWIGSPLASDWPGYHTHWTPHPPIPERRKK